jgi:hypothetical protein
MENTSFALGNLIALPEVEEGRATAKEERFPRLLAIAERQRTFLLRLYVGGAATLAFVLGAVFASL